MSGSRFHAPATIGWIAETREFHLHNDHVSYVMRVLENGTLGQLYFGSAIAPGETLIFVVDLLAVS